MTGENQKLQTTQQVPEQKKQRQSIEEELDDEEADRDLRSRQHRSGGRGKPPRRVIEESANDLYCE